ncbi:MAG TPA: L,D-transpeptidase, partial [Thermoleophilia bacterium]|nr:L,D-transpeptidase [Thermoleophilia bacterium]
QIDVFGAVLTVSRSTDGGSTFTLVNTGVVDAAGTAAWSVSPRRTNLFRVEFAGDAAWDAAAAETTVSVRPRPTLTATTPVYQGWKVTFAARVYPAHPRASVELQRRVDGVWSPLRTLRLNDESRAVFRWTSDVRGLIPFRLVMAADTDHVDGTSPVRYVRVRNPNPYGIAVRPAHFIVVDKSQYRLYYHEHGRVVRVFDCVLGRSSTPTPLGRFRIYAKDTDVGGPYGPRRMRYLGAYAIHGTNEPWLLTRFPRAYSHGCTRLANTNILWLFDRCPVGTNVWNVP